MPTVWIDSEQQDKPVEVETIEVKTSSNWRRCTICKHITIDDREHYCKECRSTDWEAIKWWER